MDHVISPSKDQPRFEDRLKPLACSYEACEAQLPTFECPYHYHPEVEIIAIHSSHGTALIDGTVSKFSGGDVFLIGSMIPHSFMNLRHRETADDWTRYTVIQFAPNLLGSKLSGCPEFSGIRDLLATSSAMALTEGLQSTVYEFLLGIHELPPSQGLLRILNALDAIARDKGNRKMISLRSGEPTVENTEHDIERLGRVFQFIHDHCTEEINLAAVSRCAAMAPSSFSRYFHNKTGKTFQDHLTEVRITEACTQLVLSDESVTNICFASGFNNLSNFNRSFRRLIGLTPSEFRRKWKQGESSNGRPFAVPPVITRETRFFRATRSG